METEELSDREPSPVCPVKMSNNYHLPSSENRTMNLIQLPNLSLIETLNQSEQTSYFEQPLNESIKDDKELYHFYKVNTRAF